MKKILLIITVSAFVFSNCKTSKYTKSSAYKPAVSNEEVVLPETVKEVKVLPPETDKPIMMKIEEVTIDKSTDLKLYPYYVIIGSFSVNENAYKLQDQQLNKGVSAVVLKSDSGMLRVASLGTESEQDARKHINQIRKESKEFPDVWLLKTK